jgi:hypothetical protein
VTGLLWHSDSRTRFEITADIVPKVVPNVLLPVTALTNERMNSRPALRHSEPGAANSRHGYGP